jgi:hypothetical protein
LTMRHPVLSAAESKICTRPLFLRLRWPSHSMWNSSFSSCPRTSHRSREQRSSPLATMSRSASFPAHLRRLEHHPRVSNRADQFASSCEWNSGRDLVPLLHNPHLLCRCRGSTSCSWHCVPSSCQYRPSSRCPVRWSRFHQRQRLRGHLFHDRRGSSQSSLANRLLARKRSGRLRVRPTPSPRT